MRQDIPARPVVTALVGEGEGLPPGLEAVRDVATVHVADNEHDLSHSLTKAHVLYVCDFRTTLLEAAWPQRGDLRWIHAASAGVDAVLTPDVRRSEVVVTNSAGVFDQGVAEFAIAALLFFAKDLRTTQLLQERHEWRHRDTELLRGRRLLVVGAGGIGRATARLAVAFGMEVAGVARSERTEDPVFGRVAPQAELRQELARADDIVIAAPLTEETRGLFDADLFAACKRGARLVNVGRGPIVDDDALLAALDSGRIGAAALDVFQEEPLPATHPYWDHPRVLVSPHQAGDFVGWERALGELFARNFQRWRRGEPLLNVVKDAHPL